MLSACRGLTSEEPPLHPQSHMYFQQRQNTQSGSSVFADGRAMRPPVPGTVARGQLHADPWHDQGLVEGKPAERLPMAMSESLLARGQERFGIYCAVCHDGAGTGNGLVIQKGFKPLPPSFHDPRLRAMAVGTLFGIITHGVRNMPSYAAQVSVDDRWAIAAYVRALQLSQHATVDQLPAEVRVQKGWEK